MESYKFKISGVLPGTSDTFLEICLMVISPARDLVVFHTFDPFHSISIERKSQFVLVGTHKIVHR